MNNLVLRIITALIGAAVIVGCVLFGAWSFAGIFMLIALLTHFEYIKTVKNTTNKAPRFEYVYSIFTGILFMLSLNATLIEPDLILILNRVCYVLLCGFIIAEIFYNRENPFQQIGLNILGIFYIPVAFGTFIYFGIAGDHSVNIWFVIGQLFLVWFNDSFAYFSGRFFGKTKLFERISPKKTWEGFLGGLVMTIICAIILSKLFDDLYTWQWILWSIIVVIAATLGDLAESLLKRSIQIKDSGSILPGHGGFLDRFDGFVLAVPFSALYLTILGFFNLLPT